MDLDEVTLDEARDRNEVGAATAPVVIDWDYLNAAVTKKVPSWKVVVPPGDPIASFYFQAISKDAPHPAAARLWEEFLYSDEGQNLFLGGGARPVRAESMRKAGTLDAAAYHALPPFQGIPVIVTGDQNAVATKYLADNWAKAIG